MNTGKEEIVCNRHHPKLHEVTRKRVPETQNKNHEDHMAEREFNSMSHYNIVHKPILMPQATKIRNAKAESKVKSKSEVVDE